MKKKRTLTAAHKAKLQAGLARWKASRKNPLKLGKKMRKVKIRRAKKGAPIVSKRGFRTIPIRKNPATAPIVPPTAHGPKGRGYSRRRRNPVAKGWLIVTMTEGKIAYWTDAGFNLLRRNAAVHGDKKVAQDEARKLSNKYRSHTFALAYSTASPSEIRAAFRGA